MKLTIFHFSAIVVTATHVRSDDDGTLNIQVAAEMKRTDTRTSDEGRQLWFWSGDGDDNSEQGDESCSEYNDSCGLLSSCCEGYSCNAGFGGDNECYHSPRLEGEPCGWYNWCRHDMFCGDDSICYGMEEIFDSGTIGKCSVGSEPGQVKIMSYNLFLIECFLDFVACQEESARGIRVQKLGEYFASNAVDADVVMFQEVFSFWEEVRDIMTNAGYCHYVTTQKRTEGSGMAVYSKYAIDNVDFIDWFDAFGDGTATDIGNFEAYADKGVMYARIYKDDKYFHITNTHTQSDSLGDEFETRLGQYEVIKEIVDRQEIPAIEMVFMGGDYNEDKACSQGVVGPSCVRPTRNLHTTDLFFRVSFCRNPRIWNLAAFGTYPEGPGGI